MNFVMEKLGFDAELNRGFIASVVTHVVLFLVAWFGVPHLFEEELIADQGGIQAVMVSTINAAPKVDRASKTITEKPKQAQKVETKKEAKPAPAKETPKQVSAPPPPEPEQQAVVIPDPTKPKEEEKKVEKKPEPKPEKKTEKKPEKEKKKSQDESDFESLVKSIAKEPAAEATPDKPKKEAAADPQESTGPIAQEYSAVPLTTGEEDGIRAAIEQRWSIPAGMANIEQYKVQLRLYMRQDGTVEKIEVVNPSNDPGYRTIAESARRAVLMTQQELGRLPIPADKYNSTIVVQWNMALVCSQTTC